MSKAKHFPILTALERFALYHGNDEIDPLERLRFFCSLAMNSRDWMDVEPFFDDLQAEDELLHQRTHMNQQDSDIALRGAELALADSIKKMRTSVHPCGCDNSQEKDRSDGVALSRRIATHAARIQEAVAYYKRCLDHYNALSGEGVSAGMESSGGEGSDE